MGEEGTRSRCFNSGYQYPGCYKWIFPSCLCTRVKWVTILIVVFDCTCNTQNSLLLDQHNGDGAPQEFLFCRPNTTTITGEDSFKKLVFQRRRSNLESVFQYEQLWYINCVRRTAKLLCRKEVHRQANIFLLLPPQEDSCFQQAVGGDGYRHKKPSF